MLSGGKGYSNIHVSALGRGGGSDDMTKIFCIDGLDPTSLFFCLHHASFGVTAEEGRVYVHYDEVESDVFTLCRRNSIRSPGDGR